MSKEIEKSKTSNNYGFVVSGSKVIFNDVEYEVGEIHLNSIDLYLDNKFVTNINKNANYKIL